jgi:hypothetical protein
VYFVFKRETLERFPIDHLVDDFMRNLGLRGATGQLVRILLEGLLIAERRVEESFTLFFFTLNLHCLLIISDYYQMGPKQSSEPKKEGEEEKLEIGHPRFEKVKAMKGA